MADIAETMGNALGALVQELPAGMQLQAVGLFQGRQGQYEALHERLTNNPQTSGLYNNLGETGRQQMLDMMIDDSRVLSALERAQNETPAADGADNAPAQFDLGSLPPGLAQGVVNEAYNDPEFRHRLFDVIADPDGVSQVIRSEMAADGTFAARLNADDQTRAYLYANEGETPVVTASAEVDRTVEAPAVPVADENAPATPGADVAGQNMLMEFLSPMLQTLMQSPIFQFIGQFFEKIGISLEGLFGSGELIMAGGGPQHEQGQRPGEEIAPDGTVVHRPANDGTGVDTYQVGETAPTVQQDADERDLTAENNRTMSAPGGMD